MTLRRPPTLPAALFFFTLTHAAPAADGEYDRRDGTYKTTNFRVSAPTPELAREFGEKAEFYRRQKAVEWLGEEMPAWPERCPLRVEVSMKQSGGATEFTFGSAGGRSVVTSQRMRIHGEARQLLNSVLPHEVTHTVLAYHFGQAVPRWADEGGSVLSENEDEWFAHDIRCREILNAERGIKLRVLFTLTEYPRDMLVVYAQGYSVCNFLINEQEGSRRRFLQFVRIGMQNGNRNWEQAVQQVYGYPSVDALQEAWIDSLRSPPQRVSARAKGAAPAAALASRGPEVRASGLPAVPLLDPPVTARGAAPDDRDDRRAARPTAPPPPVRLLLPPEPPRK